jgi:hypothetical protein
MNTRLVWLPAHADELRRLSARKVLLWVAADRKGQPLSREGHAAEMPGSVSVVEALADY